MLLSHMFWQYSFESDIAWLLLTKDKFCQRCVPSHGQLSLFHLHLTLVMNIWSKIPWIWGFGQKHVNWKFETEMALLCVNSVYSFYPSPPLKRSIFGSRCVNIFIFILDHILDLAHSETLSLLCIGLFSGFCLTFCSGCGGYIHC